MGSTNSLHIDGQSSQFGQLNRNGSQPGAGSGLHLPPGAGGNILEQIEQYQMHQRQGGTLPPEVVAQMAAANQNQSSAQSQGPPGYQYNAKGQAVNAQGQRIRTTGPPGMRGQPMSDQSSSVGGSNFTGSNNLGAVSGNNQLTEQNMYKLAGIDNNIRGYDQSSNSGSDITLRLFDRLRAQQKIQKEQKEKEKMMQQQQNAPNSSSQQSAQNNFDLQQQHTQLIQGLLQNMQSMNPQQQQEYFNQLIQQQQQYQFPIHSSDIQNSIVALGQSNNPLAEQLFQLQKQYEQRQEQEKLLVAQQMQAQSQAQQPDMTQQMFDQQQQQLLHQQHYLQQQQLLQSSDPNAQSEIPMDADSHVLQQQSNLLNKVEHVFEWSFGGENVEICGEFNKWQGEKMERIVPGEPIKGTGLAQTIIQNKVGQQPPTHYFVKFLDPLKYMYKFRVDGNWRYAPDQQITRDERGNENNIVDLTAGKTILQLLQEKQPNLQQPSAQPQAPQQNPPNQQVQFLLQQLQTLLQVNILPQGVNINPQQLTTQFLNEQQQLLMQTQQVLQQMQQPTNLAGLDQAQQQQLLMLQQQQNQKTQQLQLLMQSIQVQQQQILLQEQQLASQQRAMEQQQIAQQPQPVAAMPIQNDAQQTDRKSNPQQSPQEGQSQQSSQNRQVNNSNRNDQEQAADNVYSQKLPDEIEETVQDPQVLPIHFNYNFIERDQIPLHNQQFSKINDDYQKQTEIIKKGFFDNTLPTPSHVVLNHINSWETMSSVQSDNGNSNSSGNTKSDLTCISMPQRLNRSKFLTIIYYKPSNNNS